MDLLSALRSGSSVFAAELRPPRAELAAREGMDAWIDTYHAVTRLTRQGTFVFLTDSAVGAQEEDNLRHLVINLGRDVPRERIVPFMTSKHSLDYCLSYADRARQHGIPALVVLGGDRHVGTPRCLEHAFQLRRARKPDAPQRHPPPASPRPPAFPVPLLCSCPPLLGCATTRLASCSACPERRPKPQGPIAT